VLAEDLSIFGKEIIPARKGGKPLQQEEI